MGEGLREAIEILSKYGVSADDALRVVKGILKEADEKVRVIMLEEMNDHQNAQS